MKTSSKKSQNKCKNIDRKQVPMKKFEKNKNEPKKEMKITKRLCNG
jgi:hypothetical protein